MRELIEELEKLADEINKKLCQTKNNAQTKIEYIENVLDCCAQCLEEIKNKSSLENFNSELKNHILKAICDIQNAIKEIRIPEQQRERINNGLVRAISKLEDTSTSPKERLQQLKNALKEVNDNFNPSLGMGNERAQKSKTISVLKQRVDGKISGGEKIHSYVNTIDMREYRAAVISSAEERAENLIQKHIIPYLPKENDEKILGRLQTAYIARLKAMEADRFFYTVDKTRVLNRQEQEQLSKFHRDQWKKEERKIFTLAPSSEEKRGKIQQDWDSMMLHIFNQRLGALAHAFSETGGKDATFTPTLYIQCIEKIFRDSRFFIRGEACGEGVQFCSPAARDLARAANAAIKAQIERASGQEKTTLKARYNYLFGKPKPPHEKWWKEKGTLVSVGLLIVGAVLMGTGFGFLLGGVVMGFGVVTFIAHHASKKDNHQQPQDMLKENSSHSSDADKKPSKRLNAPSTTANARKASVPNEKKNESKPAHEKWWKEKGTWVSVGIFLAGAILMGTGFGFLLGGAVMGFGVVTFMAHRVSKQENKEQPKEISGILFTVKPREGGAIEIDATTPHSLQQGRSPSRKNSIPTRIEMFPAEKSDPSDPSSYPEIPYSQNAAPGLGYSPADDLP